MKRYISLVAIVFVIFFFLYPRKVESVQTAPGIWQVESIDTMKYSRDLSRQELENPLFDKVIDQQMQEIENTGATYVAIGTPYDNEFLPILRRWVASARSHHLHVWFRGNFSGWEGWFGYGPMTREEHITRTKAFIVDNPDLFQNGDIITTCPECENGGPGDPRTTGDVVGFRNFLIDEYGVTRDAFASINKKVISNYDSMNGDVARIVMDKQTTKALGGVVTIDNYVNTSDEMVADVKEIAASSGGKVVLGEFGAPIPDIQGDMTQDEQAAWVHDTLYQLADTHDVLGVNYWTSVGGTTALWDTKGKPTLAVKELTDAYSIHGMSGTITNTHNQPISGAHIVFEDKTLITDINGNFRLPYLQPDEKITIQARNYTSKTINVSNSSYQKIVLTDQKKNILVILLHMLGL